jgi:hypothetical protein
VGWRILDFFRTYLFFESHSHPKVKLMAIVAFNQFLGSNNKKIAEFNKQLQLTVPCGPITYTNTFDVMTKMLISSCTEATVLLTDRDIFSVPVALDINRSMWTSLMSKMDYNACVETSGFIKENILALITVVSESYACQVGHFQCALFFYYFNSKSIRTYKTYRSLSRTLSMLSARVNSFRSAKLPSII